MNRRVALTVASVAVALACGKDTPGPLIVASVEVTSPIGSRLAVGREVQLGAVARTSTGQTIQGVTFFWRASGSAAEVDAAGLVSGLAAGDAPIAATATGSSEVTGYMTLEVIAADLPGVTSATADALAVALVDGLTSTVKAHVGSALAQCGTGVTAGNFDTIDICLAELRAQAAGATDPTDQVLLATLGVFADHIERLVNP